jgi:hypothetical protein
MAKKKRKPGTGPQATVLPIKVAVEPTDDTPTYYANYAEVNLAAHEFALSFVRVPTKLGTGRTADVQESGSLELEPVVQVLFAPTLLPGLVRALTTMRAAYEERFGPIRDEGQENA